MGCYTLSNVCELYVRKCIERKKVSLAFYDCQVLFPEQYDVHEDIN